MTNIVSKSSTVSSRGSAKGTNRGGAWKVAPDIFASFRFAWAGVAYTFKTQRNFRIHSAIAPLTIILGLVLKVTMMEMAILALTCGLVLILELGNTALEWVVDITIGNKYNLGAKRAKDCAAGAVLIGAISSVLVACFILLPHGLNLIS
jgi:diacylglycerol kinase (ATP)